MNQWMSTGCQKPGVNNETNHIKSNNNNRLGCVNKITNKITKHAMLTCCRRLFDKEHESVTRLDGLSTRLGHPFNSHCRL